MWALYRRRCFPPRRVWFSSTTATTTTTSHKLKLPLLDEKKRGGGTGGYEANHSSGFLNLKLIPEEMPRIVDIRYRDLKENFFVMTRPSDISVMEYLKQAQEESSPSSSSSSVANRIGMLLDGRPGVGKSTTLLRAVHWCRQHDWLVLYMPRLFDILNASSPLLLTQPGTEKQDPWVDCLYVDRPVEALKVVENMWKAHATQLSKIPWKSTREEFISSFRSEEARKREEEWNPPHLAQYLQRGIEQYRHYKKLEDEKTAGRVITDVYLGLLEQLVQVTEYPVAFILDEYNFVYGLSPFRDQVRRRFHASAFRMMWPLRDFVKLGQSLKNGVVLAATCRSIMHYKIRRKLIAQCSRFPLTRQQRDDQTGEEQMKAWDPYKLQNLFANTPKQNIFELI
ncbi:hypothetical protein GAYE_PCTG36G0988 [Galdieria yellowstonensis]|uniref:Small ribosomal subunit protein mS29 n=1 Tax=Galdieria yellowstonensis TaxID=3028027 RepID=A0AAV9I476_9RHOD|nr:hypothetical protein GAYE_PCTG36G0988 [Galdieria yellowstonensis]